MKEYKTIRWICNECNWEWETLSDATDKQESEECLSCGSFDIRESVLSPKIDFRENFYSEN
tara:strand:+ start:1613 stop:1795 length:183 start_codon:yes stop_codon:yes gene_type:complete